MRYFEDLEDWFATTQVQDTEERKRYAVRYVSIDTEEVWRLLSKFPVGNTYDEWKAEVVALYPGADVSRKYTRPEYEDLVRRWRAKGIATMGDWSEFYREASAMSSWLISQGKLSETERDREAMQVFSSAFREKVLARLQIKQPDTHPEDGYKLANIKTAAEYLLYGTSSKPSTETSPPPPSPAGNVANAPTMKIEDSQLLDLLRAAVAGASQGASQPQYQNPVSRPPPTTQGCHYCGENGHRITDCPRVNEDI